MTWATVLVNLGLGGSNAGLLRAAAEVAQRFDARVIAVAVAQPMLIDYGGGYVSGDMIEQYWDATQTMTRDAETECRKLLEPSVKSFEWRPTSDYRSMADQIASVARAGDLIMTSMTPGDRLGSPRGVGPGDVAMQAGRPVLVVPEHCARISLDRVVIGWKDARETRRAASDALPLLKRASHVTVAEVGPEDELEASRARLADVAGWLQRHGVSAETLATASAGDDAAQLNALAQERDAGVVVAGAYGHSRLHEWALGGVTRDLLLRTERCSLLSH